MAINSDGTAIATESVSVLVSSVGRHETVSCELVVPVLILVACSLIGDCLVDRSSVSMTVRKRKCRSSCGKQSESGRYSEY